VARWAETNFAIDLTDAQRGFAFPVDTEENVRMLSFEGSHTRLQPKVGEVGRGRDVDLISALQIQHCGIDILLLECSPQVLERFREFGGGPQT
jgi:hypothetical protein